MWLVAERKATWSNDPTLLLEIEARKKVDRYRDGYANRNGTTYTFHVQ